MAGETECDDGVVGGEGGGEKGNEDFGRGRIAVDEEESWWGRGARSGGGGGGYRDEAVLCFEGE